jgi:hypothetical protein
MLWPLGLGCGSNPGDSGDFKFVYERGLVAPPTKAVVLAQRDNWLEREESTVDYRKVLHEQYLILRRPLAPSAAVIGRGHIVDLFDKGKEKDAVLYPERGLIDSDRRADRHHDIGGDAARRRRIWRQAWPATASACASRSLAGAPPRHHANSALIYRLSGNRNPLHADLNAAAAGGFKAPDPARPVHLWRGGTRYPQGLLRR